MVWIKIGNIDWTAPLGEVKVKPREKKTTKTNIRGGVMSPTPRVAYEGYSLQLQFPYLTDVQLASLEAVYTAQQPVDITQSGFEFPGGSYVPTDLSKTRIKTLDAVIYTVMVTFELDVTPSLPVPALYNHLTAGGIEQKLGL